MLMKKKMEMYIHYIQLEKRHVYILYTSEKN